MQISVIFKSSPSSSSSSFVLLQKVWSGFGRGLFYSDGKNGYHHPYPSIIACIKSCESGMSMWHNVANPMLTTRLLRPVLLPHLKPGLSNQGAYRRCPAYKLSTKAGNQDQPLKGMRRHVDIVRASVRRGMFKSMQHPSGILASPSPASSWWNPSGSISLYQDSG